MSGHPSGKAAANEIRGIGKFGPGTETLWQPKTADPQLVGDSELTGERFVLEYRLAMRALSWREFWSARHYSVRAKLAREWNGVAQLMLRDVYRQRPAVVNLQLRHAALSVFAACRAPVIDSDNVCMKGFLDGLKRWVYHRERLPFDPKAGEDARKYKLARTERPVWLLEDDGEGHVASFHAESSHATENSLLVRIEGDAFPKPAVQRVIKYPRGS